MDDALKRRLVGAFVLLAASFALASVLPDRAGAPAGEGERVVTYDLETGNEVIVVNGAEAVEPPPVAAEPAPAPAPKLRLKPSETLSTPAKPAEAPATDVAPTSARSAKEAAPKETAPAARPPAAAPGEWFVQVGSFGNQDNARAVVQKLRKKDWPVSLEPIRGSKGILYRVRIGPYATEARGKVVLASIGEEGFREARLVHE